METGHAAFCELPHMRATLDASVDANCPPAHVTGTHEEDPDRILKVPLSQKEQVVPSFPVKPGLHVQFVITLLASNELAPAGQSVHTSEAAATTTEYFPATQLIHTSDAAATVVENFPATQLVHTFDTAPSNVEYLPATQFSQISESAPVTVENLPAMQLTQTSKAAPTSIEYFPATQSEQRLEAAPITVENFPARHCVHDAGPGCILKDPAAQCKHTDGVAAFSA